MKKFLCLVLMLAVCSFFVACKKSDEKSAAQGKKQASNRQTQKQKRAKRAKAAQRIQGLQIYQDDKLIVSISRDEYATIATAPIQVKGKQEKGILLSDLLKKHNVTGKNVILRGPNRAGSISWEQATTNQIYLYPVRNRMLVFHQSKELEDEQIPVAVVRIDVGDEAAATKGKKAAEKGAT